MSLTLSSYSERAYVLRGDTERHKAALAEIGGWFSKTISGGHGWIFSKARHGEKLKTWMAEHERVVDQPVSSGSNENGGAAAAVPVSAANRGGSSIIRINRLALEKKYRLAKAAEMSVVAVTPLSTDEAKVLDKSPEADSVDDEKDAAMADLTSSMDKMSIGRVQFALDQKFASDLMTLQIVYYGGYASTTVRSTFEQILPLIRHGLEVSCVTRRGRHTDNLMPSPSVFSWNIDQLVRFYSAGEYEQGFLNTIMENLRFIGENYPTVNELSQKQLSQK
jgi:hypothetical protein